MAQKDRKKVGVSNLVFAGVTILLVIVAAIGFILYATKPSTTQTITSYSTIYSTSYSTLVSTTTTTTTTTYTKTVPQLKSGGFLNGKVITFIYTAPAQPFPNGSVFFPKAKMNLSAASWFEVGAVQNLSYYPKGAAPVFVLVPAFAGLSIFGVPQLGSTPEGFPTFTYNGKTYVVLTQCGAGLSPSMCPDHMDLIYSPAFTVVEQYLGIYNGVFGLPEGVLPTPAHSHIVTFSTNQSIPWYVVVVLVFDPNIWPDPLTGKPEFPGLVPSNLTDPSANVLNSIQALQKAMVTHSSAVEEANKNNPIWLALGKPTTQVVVPGIVSPDQLFSLSNSNIVLFFSDPEVYPGPSM